MLVLIRYRYGAGSRSYELFISFETLSQRIRTLPAGACVTAFKHPQLPLRGIVDDEFITRCLNTIPDGAEYIMTETVLTVAGKMSWFHHGTNDSHACLREDLEDSRGVPVAVGLHPDTLVKTDDIIHAVVPDEDGSVKAGPY